MGGEHVVSRRLMLSNATGGGGILPPEYQRVDWIGTDGHCLINTNVVAMGSPFFEAEHLASSESQDGLLVCFASRGEPDWTVNYYYVDHRVLGRYGSGNIFDIAPRYTADVWHTVSASREVYYDGTLTYIWSAYDFSNNIKTICLFARLNGSAGFIGKVKTCTIKDGDTVRFIGVPCCRKSDGEIGMYDTVSKTFFTNAGTGSFTKGADVN